MSRLSEIEQFIQLSKRKNDPALLAMAQRMSRTARYLRRHTPRPNQDAHGRHGRRRGVHC